MIEVENEMLWMQWSFRHFGLKLDDVHCNMQSLLDLSKNVTYYSQMMYIDIRYYWLW